MTAAFEAIGTVASNGGSVSAPGTINMSGTAIPAGVGDGFLAVIFWGNADDAPVIYDAETWDYLGDAEGGAGTWGVDTGKRHISAYWTTGDITGTTQTFVNGGANDAGNMLHGYIVRCTKSLAYWSAPASAAASDNVAGSAFSATFNRDPGSDAGDVSILALVANTDAVNPASVALAWTGATGTLTSTSPSTTSPFATGNDSRIVIRYRPTTAGPSSAAPVVTSTTDFTGAALLVRLRDSDTQPVAPPTAVAGGDAIAEPWVQLTLDGSGSGFTGTPTVEWEHLSGGTGTVTITDPTSLVTTAAVSPTTWADEAYVFRLTITDAGGSDTADVTKTVLRSSETVNVAGVNKPARLLYNG